MEISKANGWTGGQYSLYRVVFGSYLFVHFVHLAPWASEAFSSAGVMSADASPFSRLFPNILAFVDGPATTTALVLSAALASIFFAVGCRDRLAAIWLWYVLACLFGRNPLTLNPSLPFVGWLLLLHVVLPPAPYGSWHARGRENPDNGWTFPYPLFIALWIVMSVGYTYSGYTKLISPSWQDGSAILHVMQNPLARPGFIREMVVSLPDVLLKLMTWGALAAELLFAPLALSRRLRPYLWFGLLFMHLNLIVLIDFADLSLGMVVLHLIAFDPKWLPGAKGPNAELLFFDGDCGLCHRAIRFVLAEDRQGTFSFAPLQSPRFESALPAEQRANLPDSIVIVSEDQEVLTRSSAVVYIMARLGGWWRICAWLLKLIPTPLRDAGYSGVAAIRHRLFAKPSDACPLMPPEVSKRFVWD